MELVFRLLLVAVLEPEWYGVYGGSGVDDFNDACAGGCGDFLLTGTSWSFSDYENAWMICTDSSGQEQWNLQWGGEAWDYGVSCVALEDSGYIVTGVTYPELFSSPDCFLIGLDRDGLIVWERTIGTLLDDFIFDMCTGTGERLVLAGSQGIWPEMDVLLLEVDEEGNTLWQRTYERGDGNEVCMAPDGSILVAGEGPGPFGSEDGLVMKADPAGNMIWFEYLGTEWYDKLQGITWTQDGGCIAVGYSFAGGQNQTDLWILRLDRNGEVLWEKLLGGHSGSESGTCVLPEEDGLFLVTGGSSADVWVLAIDGQGGTCWEFTWGGSAGDVGGWISHDPENGRMTIAGSTSSFGAGGSDYLLACFDLTQAVPPQIPEGPVNLRFAPNPATLPASVLFTLDSPGQVSLIVFDASGRLLEELSVGVLAQGDHDVQVVMPEAPNGIYLCTLLVDGRELGTARMVLIR
jgi:hypothetical protein